MLLLLAYLLFCKWVEKKKSATIWHQRGRCLSGFLDERQILSSWLVTIFEDAASSCRNSNPEISVINRHMTWSTGIMSYFTHSLAESAAIAIPQWVYAKMLQMNYIHSNFLLLPHVAFFFKVSSYFPCTDNHWLLLLFIKRRKGRVKSIENN